VRALLTDADAVACVPGREQAARACSSTTQPIPYQRLLIHLRVALSEVFQQLAKLHGCESRVRNTAEPVAAAVGVQCVGPPDGGQLSGSNDACGLA
jgi:hypothetical protein